MNIPTGEPLKKFQLNEQEQPLAQKCDVQKVKVSDFLNKNALNHKMYQKHYVDTDEENFAKLICK